MQTHPHHNYYAGRAEADLTGWVAYFIHSMATTFCSVADEVHAQASSPATPEPPGLHRLDRRARLVPGLFTHRETITTAEIARALGLAPRTVRSLIPGWLTAGWLEVSNPARKTRSYRLSAEYRRFVGTITAGE